MTTKKLWLVFASALICLTVVARKESTAEISGQVQDAKTKLPIIEAVITLSSDAFEGQRFAVTDSTGMYKINNLPAGRYAVTFEMEGYQKFQHDTIQLSDGSVYQLSYGMVKEKKRRYNIKK